MRHCAVSIIITFLLSAVFVLPAGAQEILPFPPKPSGSIVGRTMQESIYSPLPAANHLPKDAPNILIVTIDADIPANANGVLYALGGFSGGLTCYVKDGTLSYEYNLFEIQRTDIKAGDKLPAGRVKIEVETSYVEPRPAGPLKVVLKVNGKEVASGVVPVSAPLLFTALLFTANDGLDFGVDLGSPVGLEYYDQAPFKFNGRIEQARVEYLGSAAQLQEEKRQTDGPIPVAD